MSAFCLVTIHNTSNETVEAHGSPLTHVLQAMVTWCGQRTRLGYVNKDVIKLKLLQDAGTGPGQKFVHPASPI